MNPIPQSVPHDANVSQVAGRSERCPIHGFRKIVSEGGLRVCPACPSYRVPAQTTLRLLCESINASEYQEVILSNIINSPLFGIPYAIETAKAWQGQE